MLLMAVVLIGAACSDSSNAGTTATSAATSAATGGATGTSGATGGSEGGQITIDGEKANDHGSADLSGKSTFELEADDYYFDPTTLKGTPGESIKIEIKNEGGTKHNFTIEDQKVDEDIDPGKTVDVTVKFPSSGIVEFHCEYHRSLGMVGQLTTA
jgi:plastocyanin